MIRSVLRDERGAIVVDWLALSAGVLLLAITVVASIMEEAGEVVLAAFATDHAVYAAGPDPAQGTAALRIRCRDTDAGEVCSDWHRQQVGGAN